MDFSLVVTKDVLRDIGGHGSQIRGKFKLLDDIISADDAVVDVTDAKIHSMMAQDLIGVIIGTAVIGENNNDSLFRFG